MQNISIYILIIFSCIFLFYLYKEIQEIIFLKKALKSIIGKSKIESIEDLIKIKKFLNKNINYNDEFKNDKRPILRATASQTLKTNYGFCGENARVAIKFLLLGGIKARRIYLFRKVWQHVLIEHQWENEWFMFDGHYDPDTILHDSKVASINSENINNYPDDYPNNPYLEFCRVKLFYKISPLKSLSKTKLPSPIVYIMESPYLIKAFLFLLLSTAAITYLL